MVKILIDPGHGGRDAGATGNGLLEKELTLDIAKRLFDILSTRYQGIEVRLSRDTDRYLSLKERADVANRWGADLVLSIHINAGGGTGFESYIHNSRPKVAERWRQLLHREVIAELGSGIRDRGMKAANFAILRQTRMPAILTESLFIDHAQDAQRLNDPSFRQRIASGHALGIASIFDLKPRPSHTSSSTDQGSLHYRVVAGSFRERENAEKRVDQLKEAGIEAFIDIHQPYKNN